MLPVTVYSADKLQRLGANTPAEGLRLDPSSLGNTATENDSNGGNGTARLSLRGFGPQNVVTLINGRRAFGFANLNALPLGALDRVELLRDGAGLVYGADAVAGVANFILLNGPAATPFNGFEVDVLYGNTTDKDARVIQGSIRGGFSNKKMAIAFAAEYYDRGAIFSRDRAVSASADRRALGGNNGGSATFPGRVTLGGQARILNDPTFAPTPTAPLTAASYRAYGGANSPDPFNFRLYTPAIPAQEKYQTYLTGQYNIFGKAMTAYADLLYAKTKQDNGLAPVPFTLSRAEAVASPFNPFVATTPTSNPSRISGLSYRLTDELGLRRSFYDQDYWRYTVGLKGDFVFKNSALIDFLSYDGGLVYERFDQVRTDSGDALRSVLVAEIAAGRFNPFRGQASPLAGLSNTYDATTGAITGTRSWDNRAAAERASYLGRSFDRSRDFLLDAKISGNLFPTLPQGGLGFNLGTEYRQSRTDHLPDATQLQGDQLGFTPQPANKYRTEVRSYFAEFSVPLVTHKMKVPLVRSLDFSAGLRSEDYEFADQRLGGSIEPATGAFRPGSTRFHSGVLPRYTLRYQPVEDLVLRGSYGENYRPPTADDLFAAQTVRAVPFGSPLPVAPILLRQGGNPNLRGEESTSWTAGLVYYPRQVRGLSLTVDYYQTRTTGLLLGGDVLAQLLGSVNANSLLAGAAFPGAYGYVVDPANPGAIPPARGYVGRSPRVNGGGGEIRTILAQTANVGRRFVQGIEATLQYQLPWDRFGSFTVSAAANYLFSWKTEAVSGIGTTDFLGDYNGSLPLAPGGIPRLKGYVRLEYAYKGWQWVGTVNYVGSYNDDSAALLAANLIGGGDTTPVYDLYRKVPSYVTFDTQLSYEFKRPLAQAREVVDGKGVRTSVYPDQSGSFAQKLLWGTKIRVGVVNLFDRSPPSVLGAFNDNYDTSLYSLRNRYVYVGLNKKF
ncbi:MAG: TonB-dependent receptor [Verrucomicrobia bacterium]|nr:TonB-dependent receptor [Verrucomicrobiota bacterium]